MYVHVLTAEINAYKRIAGEAIFEIGRRLNHVKSNDLAHGSFGDWLASVDFNWDTANRFMRIARELGGNSDSYRNIGWQALYLIATLPPEERTRPHTIPSTGETKYPKDMTVKELRETKAKLRAAEERIVEQRRRAEKAEEDYEVIRDTLESIETTRIECVADPGQAERIRKYEARPYIKLIASGIVPRTLS